MKAIVFTRAWCRWGRQSLLSQLTGFLSKRASASRGEDLGSHRHGEAHQKGDLKKVDPGGHGIR